MRPAWVGVAASAVLLSGCSVLWGWDGTGGVEVGQSGPGTPTDTVAQVEYYPACGNELLEHDGTTWYPFKPTTDWPEPIFDGPTASALGLPHGGRGVAAVAAPGPGDDVGTLVVYDNGIAYWMSDSLTLGTWLTTKRITYNWVC
jgi:hypothetical protein